MKIINLNRGQQKITVQENELLNDTFEYVWTNAPEMIKKLVKTSIITKERVSEINLLRWVINLEDTLSQL